MNNDLPRSAEQARAIGATKYFTGAPCKRGHLSVRTTSGNACDECSRIWKNENRERLRAYEAARNSRPERRDKKRSVEKEWRESKRRLTPWVLCIRNSKKRASKKGIEFSLTEEWAASKWTGLCSITGIPFDVHHGARHTHPMAPSIDRVDSNRGYVEDNCRFILSCVNTFRSTMGDAQMRDVAAAIIGRA